MAARSFKNVAVCLSALVLGGVVSFFTAGPALFADGPYIERVMALVLSIAAFALLGVVLGVVVPVAWRAAALYAWMPHLLVLAFFGREALESVPVTVLLVGFTVGDLASVLAGALLGARLMATRYANR